MPPRSRQNRPRPQRPNRPNRPGNNNNNQTTPTPNVPSFFNNESSRSFAGVKPATPDIIEFDTDALEVDALTDLIFEEIGGQELINIARNDIINGQSVRYQPIKNINKLANKYNPQNILYIPQTSYSFFNNFPLKFVNYLPNEGTGPEGKTIYLDESGNLVINLVNIRSNEEVEVQVFDQPNIFNGTIYEGDS